MSIITAYVSVFCNKLGIVYINNFTRTSIAKYVIDESTDINNSNIENNSHLLFAIRSIRIS